jgi:hypothetical protein
MSPLSPNSLLVELLGPTLCGLRGRQPRRLVGTAPEYPGARDQRATDLGISEDVIVDARVRFDDHCEGIRTLPAPVRALRRHGLDENQAAMTMRDWVAGTGPGGPRARLHPLAGRQLQDVAYLMERLFGKSLHERIRDGHRSQFDRLFPGNRYLPRSGHDEGVCIYFVDDKRLAGGHIDALRTVEENRKGQKAKRITGLRCVLRISEACGPTILKQGILGSRKALTVWAEELFNPQLPPGIRAFDAVWVVAKPGYQVSTCEGIIVKTARGALEHYENPESLEAVLQRRKSNSKPRPFRLSKARRTVAEKLSAANLKLGGDGEREDLNSLKF